MLNHLPRPSYEEAIQYYLRDDVAHFFWQLAQRRQLKFFHHCETDPKGPTRPKPRGIVLHCVESVDVLREKILSVTTAVPSYAYDFFPFFGIQSSVVNVSGQPDEVMGWDLRFEYDHKWPYSFAIVLPIVALLTHFHVPVLAKYSGHRSLHIIIPAEAFPLSMKQNSDHTVWMQTFDLLGNLLCRIAPYVLPTGVGLGKALILTAPYSFHRYNGFLSLPLSLRQAMAYDRAEAVLDRFPGIDWQPPDTWGDGAGMAALLETAERANQDPEIALKIAEEVFAGPEWGTFVANTTPTGITHDSALGLLMAGLPGIKQSLVNGRVQQALLVVDEPENKTMRFGGLVGGDGQHLSLERALAHRRARCQPLAVWASESLEAAFQFLLDSSMDSQYAASVTLAVRLLSYLPERPCDLLNLMQKAWHNRAELPQSNQLFLALSLAEMSGVESEALGMLYVVQPTPRLDSIKRLLAQTPDWRTETMPHLALSGLALSFGETLLHDCLEPSEDKMCQTILTTVFAGKAPKLIHAARTVIQLTNQ